MSIINRLENNLTAAHLTLQLGSIVLGYQVIAKIVDRIAPTFIKIPPSATFLLLLPTTVYVSLQAPVLTFLFLCLAYVRLSILENEKKDKETPLPSFMRDLIQEAKSIEKCYYTGHENYVREIEIIMQRKEKNNAILVGPPGIGKSAIFEKIAWDHAHGKILPSSPLANKRLIEINMTDLIGGTMFRGSLEIKVKQMLDLAEKDPSIVYVIDEIHKIMGAGASMQDQIGDVANQLKIKLARGLKILGATTPLEYKASIEKDPALERRFTEVYVSEPTPRECLKMLQTRGEQNYYTYGQHIFKIADDALKAAIFFSKRDHPKKFLPDIANTLLDTVCAIASLNPNPKKTIEVDDIIKRHTMEIKKWSERELWNQYHTLRQYSGIFVEQS